jgi:heme-degrading monooxygenase HmoA
MSTLMMMRAKVDPSLAERMASGDPNPFAELASMNPRGILRHRVFAGDGELVVVDEWERPEDFEAWRSSPRVAEIFTRVMSEAGVTEQPQVIFARELDLGDKIG